METGKGLHTGSLFRNILPGRRSEGCEIKQGRESQLVINPERFSKELCEIFLRTVCSEDAWIEHLFIRSRMVSQSFLLLTLPGMCIVHSNL